MIGGTQHTTQYTLVKQDKQNALEDTLLDRS